MHAALEDRDQTIRELQLRVMELSQRREDALKQLDELIARVGGLEAYFESRRESKRESRRENKRG